ncbi:hypothetical protein [Xanthomonas graminis]|uniref:Uncharacterized protein n=1 Tax=Xanthomonas graminis pv. poae TaxID=227946 RepID=A0A199NY78_9XANT|nr:hypothetical protein [Xanthomonas translucens]OAX53608.1 hypothetical protein A6R73_06270 [Xanthomonas translucens pv. poae]
MSLAAIERRFLPATPVAACLRWPAPQRYGAHVCNCDMPRIRTIKNLVFSGPNRDGRPAHPVQALCRANID